MSVRLIWDFPKCTRQPSRTDAS